MSAVNVAVVIIVAVGIGLIWRIVGPAAGKGPQTVKAGYAVLCLMAAVAIAAVGRSSQYDHDLFLAAAKGDADAVASYLKLGASPNVAEGGRTALCAAIESGTENAATMLVRGGANLTAGCEDKTAIRAAIAHGMYEVQNEMKEMGAHM